MITNKPTVAGAWREKPITPGQYTFLARLTGVGLKGSQATAGQASDLIELAKGGNKAEARRQALAIAGAISLFEPGTKRGKTGAEVASTNAGARDGIASVPRPEPAASPLPPIRSFAEILAERKRAQAQA